jgi:hypothetical protein
VEADSSICEAVRRSVNDELRTMRVVHYEHKYLCVSAAAAAAAVTLKIKYLRVNMTKSSAS